MNAFLKKSFGTILFSSLVFTLSFSQKSFAGDEPFSFINRKQEEKEKYRWSLSSWWGGQEQVKAQNLWLALHTPTPYESYVGASYQLNQATPGSANYAWEGYIGAYATIFGLEGRYLSGLNNQIFAQFNLRIFGYHDQSTNLTLQVGARNLDTGSYSYRNAYAGLSAALYFNQFVGISGLYRYYFPSTPTPLGMIFSGQRYEAGGFFDFRFLRFYANYFNDAETAATVTGIIAGIKMYF